ncbi:MAG TPA: dienelactone hydrolase family protein [Gemmatimonadales bacterium]|jgi:carboxymethylenebutenolidase
MPDVMLPIADGTTARAFVARPGSAQEAPGLILFQEAFGVNSHIRDLAGRFAGEGYVVIAPEMFHRTADPGFEARYDDFESVRPHMTKLTPAGIAADAAAAYHFLAHDSQVDPERIAAIGYCMGGRCTWIANATVPLGAAVSYYGGGIAPALLDRAALLNGPHLFFWGGLDTHIPAEQRTAIINALDSAQKPFINVEMSEAGHGFFCEQRPSYHADSAAESWALTLEFLKRKLA